MNDTQKLNTLVADYQQNPSDSLFAEIYEMVRKDWRNLRTVAKSIMAEESEVIAAYDDALIRCINLYDGEKDFINFVRLNVRWARQDIYKKKKFLKRTEQLALTAEENAATFELADEFNLEETIIAKKEADQRQLIDSLLSGADAKTTAIVEAALTYQPSNKTGRPLSVESFVADKLGIDRRSVIRKLESLAGEFDYKQFGDYHDYLLAI